MLLKKICHIYQHSHNSHITNTIRGCVKTPNIKILNSLCVHLWMRNEFFIFL